jgi:hypothetical protein
LDPELSRQKFGEQMELLTSLTETTKDNDWKIVEQYPLLYCLMHPKKHLEMKFMVRLRCDDYPQRSPSLQFVDPITKKEGAEYWPKQGAAFQAALSRGGIQLCIPGIREYHEGCHNNPNDANPWRPERYTFVDILQRVQLLLDEYYP